MFGKDDLPIVAEVNEYALGATASVVGNAHDHGRSDPYVARTQNRVDSRLAVALAGPRMVLVVGTAKVGKTRTLFEAVRAHDRLARVLVPARNSLSELIIHPRLTDSEDLVVVWLDDLHEYLNSADPLTPALLARLTDRPGRTIVVATLRSENREQLCGGGELQRDTRLLLEQALTIDLVSMGEDPDEKIAAVRTYPDLDLVPYGLSEFLGGGPELTDQQRQNYNYEILQKMRDDPGWAFRMAADAGDPAAMYSLGLVLAGRGAPGEAESWSRKAVDAGHPEAMYRLGTEFAEHGEKQEAQSWYRKAADTGHRDAMYALATIFAEREELDEAETWFRKASIAGHHWAIDGLASAMYKFGIALAGRGELDEAASWYRKAADIGSPEVTRYLPRPMFDLGVLHAERGQHDEAASWYRKAADAGYAGAMYHLGVLLAGRGELDEAASWLGRADRLGHPDAPYRLADVFAENGEGEKAESMWHHMATSYRSPEAMYKFGIALAGHGDLDEAAAWLRQAAIAGHPDATNTLSDLLAERRRRRRIWPFGWIRR